MKKQTNLKNVFIKENLGSNEDLKDLENIQIAMNSMKSVLDQKSIDPGNPVYKKIEDALNSMESLLNPGMRTGVMENSFDDAYAAHEQDVEKKKEEENPLITKLDEPFSDEMKNESDNVSEKSLLLKHFNNPNDMSELISIARGSLGIENVSDDLMDKLLDYYIDEMPYGTQKARTGDPYVWLTKKLESVLGSPESLNECPMMDNIETSITIEVEPQRPPLDTMEYVTIIFLDADAETPAPGLEVTNDTNNFKPAGSPEFDKRDNEIVQEQLDPNDLFGDKNPDYVEGSEPITNIDGEIDVIDYDSENDDLTSVLKDLDDENFGRFDYSGPENKPKGY